MAEYLIQGETLTAIANAIREFSSVGNAPMAPAQMAGNIEQVYDSGYDFGFEEGASSVKSVLYGTYILASSPNYTAVTETKTFEIPSESAYVFMFDGTNYIYTNISSIQWSYFLTDAFYINSNENRSIMWGKYAADVDYAWLTVAGTIKREWSDRCRAIDFVKPVEVTQEFYDLFMTMVDNSETTPYNIGENIGYDNGYDTGYNEGLEADVVHGSRTEQVSPSTGYNIGPCLKMSYTPDERMCFNPGSSYIDLVAPFSDFGDAGAGHVVAGKKFTSGVGLNAEGTLKTYMTWVLSDPTTTTPIYRINFVSNGVEYTSFSVSQYYNAPTQTYLLSVYYINGEGSIPVYRNETWADENYKTIAITGGTDAANSSLITYLNTHATLQF